MPSEDWLRRLEALNGGPLRETVAVEETVDMPDEGAGAAVAVVKAAPRAGASRTRRALGDKVALHDAAPGEERLTSCGRRYYHVERFLEEHADWCAELGADICTALPGVRSGRTRRAHAVMRPEDVLFLDVETLGLRMESPVFLVGLVGLDRKGRVFCRQILAREPDEEHAAIAAAAAALAGAKLLVSFNGRSYDMPLLRSRAETFGVDLPDPPAHVDMLLEARRRYARKLPNCRLQTLEERVCGRTREDDVPSARIPGVYRQFVKTGNAATLQKVIHHNLLDLATTAELFTLFFG